MIRIAFIFLLICLSLEAAPYYRSPASRGTTVQESLGELRHDVDNHEAEIRQLEERLTTQEMVVDTFRGQLKETRENEKELFKGQAAIAEIKIASLETDFSRMTADIQELKTSYNESSKAFAHYQLKIEMLEKNIGHLQTALQSILAAIQGDEVKSTDEAFRYQVKNGDSLEKIAKRHQTTVQKIKEINSLKSDRIFVGQQLIVK